jgi:hypothetical protein
MTDRVVVTIEKKNGKQTVFILRQLAHDSKAIIGQRMHGGRIVAVAPFDLDHCMSHAADPRCVCTDGQAATRDTSQLCNG